MGASGQAGSGRAWLSRELQWSAYSLRSGVSYEECRGRRIISQGGYYQYDLGFQGAFRDPLQHVLPMIYASPGIARDVLLYSASQQPREGGQVPYAMSSLCRPNDALEDANDMDLWLLWTAAEYVLATRDTRRPRRAGALRRRRPRLALEAPQVAFATRSRCSGRTAATSRPARATGRTSPPLSCR